jgi:predicted Ser/Thr protein kinase
MAATNTQARALTDAQRTVLEGWLVEFERTWGEGRLAARVRELPPGPLRFPALVELVKIDLERSWEAGARPNVESYLGAYPELGTPDAAPADLLLAEWEARQRHGEEAALAGFASRFPGRAKDLRRLVEEGPGAPTFAKPSTLRQPGADSSPDTTRVEPDVALRLERQGRYQVVRKLGRGGMGSVYLVRDTRLDRPVALKVPRFDGDDDPEVRERFYREARAVSGLHHPNICPVYDVGEIDGVPYLTMAYIEGEPLSQRLAAGPLPSPAEAAALVRKLARALEAAHGHKVIHRDLKPANVMIGADGEPVVMDFGLARRADRGDVRLTQTGALMGTPAYMSPEQAGSDPAAVGPASDVYSLGVMLYELATGRPPFAGSLADVLWQIRAEEPTRPTELRPDLSPELERIILRAMAKSVDKRYPTAGAFAAALEDYLQRQEEAPIGRRPRTGPRWVWPVAAALVLAAAAIVLAALWHPGATGRSSAPELAAAGPGTAPGPGGGDSTGRGQPTEKGGGAPPERGQPTGRGGKPARKPQPPVIIKAPEKKLDVWGVTPDGKTVVRVLGKSVELWDADTGKLRATLDGPIKGNKSLDISPDGRFLAVGGYRSVKVWDLKDNKELVEFEEPKTDVLRLLFSPDGKRLLGVAGDGPAWWWDVAGKKVLKEAKVGGYLTERAWFPFPERNIVLATKLLPPPPPPGTFAAQYMDLSGTPPQALLDTADLTVKPIDLSKTTPGDVDVSTDGKRLLVGVDDNVLLYDMEKGKSQPVHHRHKEDVYMVKLSPDGKLAASGGKDMRVVLWDLEANKERDTYKKGFDGPVGVRFSPDGKALLAWTLRGKDLRRWDVAGGMELPPLSGHDGGIYTAIFRGEGQFLFVVEDDGKVTRYDTAGLPE